MRTLVILLLGVVAVSALPRQSSRIVGGSVTTIHQYPQIASLLYSATNSGHRQTCVGTILNNISILTAANCIHGDGIHRWRTRLGSANANSGGTVKNTHSMRYYPSYNINTRDHDIAIIRVSSTIVFSTTIRAGSFAGATYHVPDNDIVWAAGWGYIGEFGPASEQLRHVQKWSINLITCRQRYLNIGRLVTDNMLCSGWLDVGGRDHCHGDNGAPLFHNGVVAGVRSWGEGCGRPNFPGVSTRVQRYTSWILQNQ